MSSRRARVSPRRRLHRRFFWIGVVGVAAIAFFVVREVGAIREASRAYEDEPADVEWPARPAEARVRLVERRPAEPGAEGRYVLSVDGMRWELETPAADAGEAAWVAWAEASQPRWAALEQALTALAAEDPGVRAEVFAAFDDPRRVPSPFLVRLLETLGRAGILDVDVPLEDE